MQYPAIVYSLNKLENLHANGGVYLSDRQYTVILIDEDPDSLFISKLGCLPTCSFIRTYRKDNLNHYVYQLYY